MQNYKKYAVRPAQLIIADVHYNVGTKFYGSNPMWYKNGDRKNQDLRKNQRLIVILTSTCMSIFTSVRKCSKRMIQKPSHVVEVPTTHA